MTILISTFTYFSFSRWLRSSRLLLILLFRLCCPLFEHWIAILISTWANLTHFAFAIQFCAFNVLAIFIFALLSVFVAPDLFVVTKLSISTVIFLSTTLSISAFVFLFISLLISTFISFISPPFPSDYFSPVFLIKKGPFPHPSAYLFPDT